MQRNAQSQRTHSNKVIKCLLNSFKNQYAVLLKIVAVMTELRPMQPFACKSSLLFILGVQQ